MGRSVLLVLVAALTISLFGGTALAKPGHGGRGPGHGDAIAKPAKSDAALPSERLLKGLTAPLRVEKGQPRPQSGRPGKATQGNDAGRDAVGTTATARWFDGTTSNTYYFNPITNVRGWLTTQWVGFWATGDGSYPKTGELYYGRAVIGNVGIFSTPVLPNIELPPNTRFAINPSDPNMRIRCILENFQTGGSTELTGDNCPQQVTQGTYGAHFAPAAGYWTIQPGQAITVIFPIFSTAELKGIAATPADCLIGSTWAGASDSGWDTPRWTDECPLPKDRGVWQGVHVAFNAPTVGYPTPSATNVTATSARTTAHLFSHFDPGAAFAELGTDTSYGTTSRIAIAGSSDSFTVTTDWPDLEPDTVYHWRLRFVDDNGRTFTGADQTFRTAASRDREAPKVTQVQPAENARGVAPGVNVVVSFSEAMQAGTVNGKTIKLFKKGSSTTVRATVTYDAGTKKAVLDPSAKLQGGATYKVVVGTGVKDVAGNPLAQQKTWSFVVKN